MENNQTPEVIPAQDPATATEGGDNKGTEAVDSAPTEPAIDYKEKFSASTTENQRIMAENKTIQDNLRAKEAAIDNLEREKQEIESRLKEENPEAYDALKVNKELNSLKKDVILQKEELAINSFIADRPEAKAHKDALRMFGRANPDVPLSELYDRHIKPTYEAGMRDYETKQKLNKQVQPESGRSLEEQPGAVDDDFNSKPLEERKRLLKAQGL